ncbi:MAG: ATP-dependent sacrificial sulfur transferase LarE [Anaerolineae bacterium]
MAEANRMDRSWDELAARARPKEEAVLAFLRAQDRVAVALSGGTDSTYLLALAVEALGPQRVLALTAHSEFEPPEEVEEARTLAERLGARHQVVPLSLLTRGQVADNPPDRCYWCKRHVLTAFREVLPQGDAWTLVYGANASDLGDYRPGERAARELGVHAPLQEAGLTKEEIRALARARNLPNWDRPSAACLASRFPYGTRLTQEKLDQVAAAERFLRTELGLRRFRVRAHGDVARLELPREDWPLVLDEARLPAVVEHLRALGFIYVTLDLMGLRSGSMNDALKTAA